MIRFTNEKKPRCARKKQFECWNNEKIYKGTTKKVIKQMNELFYLQSTPFCVIIYLWDSWSGNYKTDGHSSLN